MPAGASRRAGSPPAVLSCQGVGGLPLVALSFLSSPAPAENPVLFRKPSERVHELEGVQFPSLVGAMERAPQGLSPPEPVGTTATMPMQEAGGC